jgi:hypothetical protein
MISQVAQSIVCTRVPEQEHTKAPNTHTYSSEYQPRIDDYILRIKIIDLILNLY